MEVFDLIVVGGGHAGVEAVTAANRLGVKTLLITSRIDRMGFMSCNPSIGGLAKGHMVRELDVFGGLMGVVADKSTIQYKKLNQSKGPAVRGTRVQTDKKVYSELVSSYLSHYQNVKIHEGNVSKLLVKNNSVYGVQLDDGSEIGSRHVILTTGTFLNAVLHIGNESKSGGRIGEKAVHGLSDQLFQLGFKVDRFKTGTPARLDKNSINWGVLKPQYGDSIYDPFSLRSSKELELPQVPCYLSRTSEKTHDIISQNLHQSPIYGGKIEGTGPRYCPSIEDKVVRFSERKTHQTFLEPESLSSNLIYLQGISTSLPISVQDQFLKTILGLEKVKVIQYGYAVEYDLMQPTQVKHTLETKSINGLYFAGQINGTSGYEEAGVQGMVAAVNACLSLSEKEPFSLSRSDSYIGVLIDDLVTKGTSEPYRMFTSRAEFRMTLREDNVLERLFGLSERLNLLSFDERVHMERSLSEYQKIRNHSIESKVYPNAQSNKVLECLGSTPLKKPTTLWDLLKRPELKFNDLSLFGLKKHSSSSLQLKLESDSKYSGYIERELEQISKSKQFDENDIPLDFDYSLVHGLSSEEIEKLNRYRPNKIGQIGRISGINPSSIRSIVFELVKWEKTRGEFHVASKSSRMVSRNRGFEAR